MTQQPLDSGFGPASSADDVMEGVDLDGRTVLVTGGASGLGLESVRALIEAGGSVIVPARRPIQAAESLGGWERVTILPLDLVNLDDVRRFASGLVESGVRLDGVIAAAGIMACPLTRVGPGWEAQFAVNHLGHFALVNALLSVISGDEARVIVYSSGAHFGSDIRWDDLHFASEYDRWAAYAQSKTANILFSVWLDRVAQERGVRSFALHPGVIQTPLQRHFSREEQIELGWMDATGAPADWFKTRSQGAATGLWGLTSPALKGSGGLYLEDCEVAPLALTDDAGRGVRPHAVDLGSAKRLWDLSAELTGVSAF